MPTAIHRQVAACRAGEEARCIGRLSSGWLLLGPVQMLPGYALLLPDPVVAHLNALTPAARRTVLYEASVVGDALLALTDAVRINYEILGNLEPALHVHIVPRFSTEPAELRTRPVWFYDWDTAPPFDPARDAALMAAMRDYLANAGVLSP